jgi:DNA-binding transcriptional MerR regulator
MEKNRYAIGEVSESCNIPVKTLRYYDEIGLLHPKYRGAKSNYRYYSKEQLTTLLIIRRLRAMDFSLKEIKKLMTESDLGAYEEKIVQHSKNLQDEICALQVRLADCKDLLSRIRRGKAILDEQQYGKIQIEFIPKCHMVFRAENMKQYRNMDVSLRRWTDILEQCTSHRVVTRGSVIVTFHTQILDQFLMKDCDVEFGLIVSEECTLPDDITNVRAWGGFQAATSYHAGKYREIMQSHVKLLQWIHLNGYEISGPVSEEFVVSPLDVDNEEEHVTRIIMPIQKIR